MRSPQKIEGVCQQCSVTTGSADIGVETFWLSFPWKQSRQKDKMATFVTLMESKGKVVDQLFDKKRLDGILSVVNGLFIY